MTETTTSDTTSSFESASVKEEKPECSSITRNNSTSTVNSCKTGAKRDFTFVQKWRVET
ncbi:hypothetical protein ACJMK2_039505, partial [Sinanodonta woodiana]